MLEFETKFTEKQIAKFTEAKTSLIKRMEQNDLANVTLVKTQYTSFSLQSDGDWLVGHHPERGLVHDKNTRLENIVLFHASHTNETLSQLYKDYRQAIFELPETPHTENDKRLLETIKQYDESIRNYFETHAPVLLSSLIVQMESLP